MAHELSRSCCSWAELAIHSRILQRFSSDELQLQSNAFYGETLQATQATLSDVMLAIQTLKELVDAVGQLENGRPSSSRSDSLMTLQQQLRAAFERLAAPTESAAAVASPASESKKTKTMTMTIKSEELSLRHSSKIKRQKREPEPQQLSHLESSSSSTAASSSSDGSKISDDDEQNANGETKLAASARQQNPSAPSNDKLIINLRKRASACAAASNELHLRKGKKRIEALRSLMADVQSILVQMARMGPANAFHSITVDLRAAISAALSLVSILDEPQRTKAISDALKTLAGIMRKLVKDAPRLEDSFSSSLERIHELYKRHPPTATESANKKVNHVPQKDQHAPASIPTANPDAMVEMSDDQLAVLRKLAAKCIVAAYEVNRLRDAEKKLPALQELLRDLESMLQRIENLGATQQYKDISRGIVVNVQTALALALTNFEAMGGERATSNLVSAIGGRVRVLVADFPFLRDSFSSSLTRIDQVLSARAQAETRSERAAETVSPANGWTRIVGTLLRIAQKVDVMALDSKKESGIAELLDCMRTTLSAISSQRESAVRYFEEQNMEMLDKALSLAVDIVTNRTFEVRKEGKLLDIAAILKTIAKIGIFNKTVKRYDCLPL